MKKMICICLILMISLFSIPHVSAEGIGVSARAAILIEAETGRVLFEKNADQHLPMASTTKIMTALLTLESGDLDRVVTVTDEMVRVEGSSMGLLPGDSVTLEGLAQGMLLASGNDAANTAAIAVGGTVENFVKMMNERAKSMGAKNTNFVTPSGLDAELHYSTARDMAIIGMNAMKNEQFKEIASSKTIAASYGNPPYKRTLSNHNRLLREYDGAIGVKTGFTKKSGRCLVSSAERDGVRLIVVTLDAPSDWNDHKQLLNYGFSQMENVPIDDAPVSMEIPVTGGLDTNVIVQAEGGLPNVSLKKGEAKKIKSRVEAQPFLYAPIQEGSVVGRVIYSVDGKDVAEQNLIAKNNVEAIVPKTFFDKVGMFFQNLWNSILN